MQIDYITDADGRCQALGVDDTKSFAERRDQMLTLLAEDRVVQLLEQLQRQAGDLSATAIRLSAELPCERSVSVSGACISLATDILGAWPVLPRALLQQLKDVEDE